MGSRNRTTLILFVIFAVLFGYYWFVQKDKPMPSEDTETPSTNYVVTAYDPASLQEITWKYESGSGKSVKDASGNWKLTEPAIVGDSEKISAFIQSISNLSGDQKYPTSELSLDESGVNSPTLTLTIKLNDSQTDTLRVGKKTVDNSYYFVHKNNEDFTVLVSTYLIDELKKDPYTLTPSPSTSPSPAASIVPLSSP